MASRTPLTILVLAGLVLGTLATSIWLFPYDSDGAFVVHDALAYGMHAERTPAASINPNHPLFHALVLTVVDPLRRLEVPNPGHVACRVVAGVFSAWLLIQICALAGCGRLLVGSAFAFVIATSRGFLVETASGENVMPSVAAALFAIRCASRPSPSLALVTFSLALALLLRQDNVFIVPGIAAGIAMGMPSGKRARGVATVLAAGGVLTIAGYLAAWKVATGPDTAFLAWLPGIGRNGQWLGPAALDWSRFATYAANFAVALTGRLGPPPGSNPLVSLGYVAAIVAAGLLLRGRDPRSRLLLPIVITLASRALFHTWFEPDNFEWLVLPLVLVVAFAAGQTHGEPGTAPIWRRIGILLLLALSAWALFSHGRWTWKLRERTFMRSVEEATNVDRSDWRFLSASIRAHQALELLMIPHGAVKEGPGALAEIVRDLNAHPQRTTIIWDRGLIDGMPWSLRHAPDFVHEVDTYAMPAEFQKLYQGRMVTGVRWTPGQESRPDSRK